MLGPRGARREHARLAVAHRCTRADRSVQCSASFMPVARQVSRQGLPNRDVSYSSGSLMFMLKYYWKKIQFYD